MYSTIDSIDKFNEIVEANIAVLFYFSHEQCNVCKVLKPKIQELIASFFPKIELYYCDTIKSPAITAQKSIFVVPTIIIYFAGKEIIRKSRNLGIEELKTELERPYLLIFE